MLNRTNIQVLYVILGFVVTTSAQFQLSFIVVIIHVRLFMNRIIGIFDISKVYFGIHWRLKLIRFEPKTSNILLKSLAKPSGLLSKVFICSQKNLCNYCKFSKILFKLKTFFFSKSAYNQTLNIRRQVSGRSLPPQNTLYWHPRHKIAKIQEALAQSIILYALQILHLFHVKKFICS
jgi:hypothetical protein